jgi:hypothetical protein
MHFLLLADEAPSHRGDPRLDAAIAMRELWNYGCIFSRELSSTIGIPYLYSSDVSGTHLENAIPNGICHLYSTDGMTEEWRGSYSICHDIL